MTDTDVANSSNRKQGLRKYSALLSDNYTLKILAATLIRPKGVEEICMNYDIPITAGYRRVRKLVELGLLKCTEEVLSRRGKRMKVYKSCVRNIAVVYERGKVSVKLGLTTNDEILTDDWDVLSAAQRAEG